MRVGEIYRHAAFYADSTTGELKPKYFLVLAVPADGDLVVRLLTSRATGRPEHPPCFHGNPYPGYFLGVIGGPLTTKSWLDLRAMPDLDEADVERRQRRGIITAVAMLASPVMREVLACAAAADDTTRQQERAIREQLSTMGEA